MLKWPIKPVHCLYMHAPLKIVQHFSTHFKVGMIIAVTGSHTYPQACTHARTHARTHTHTYIHTHTHTHDIHHKQTTSMQTSKECRKKLTHSEYRNLIHIPEWTQQDSSICLESLGKLQQQQWTQQGSSICPESFAK